MIIEIVNVKSIEINDTPTFDNHVVNKKYVDSVQDENTNVRLNSDSNENYLQVRVQNTAYNLQIYNKTQIIDTTVIKNGNNGGYLLQQWKIECNNKNGDGKINDFIKSTKTNSPTNNSGATSLPPIGDAFMYIEEFYELD